MANTVRERAYQVIKQLPQPFEYNQFAANLGLSDGSCRQMMSNLLASGWIVRDGSESESLFYERPHWNRNNKALYYTRFTDTPFYRFVRELLPSLPSPFKSAEVCTIGKIPPWAYERVRVTLDRLFVEDLIHPMVHVMWTPLSRGRPSRLWTAKLEEILRQKDLQAELDAVSQANSVPAPQTPPTT